MKNKILLFFLGFSLAASAQVKMGDNPGSLGTSSALELESTNKAMLITRVTNTSLIEIPVNGMMVYEISSNRIKIFQNGAWTLCLGYDPTTAVLLQIGEEGDSPNTVPSTVTVVQIRTIVPAISGIVSANQAAYQAYIDANPNNFSNPATVAEVQAMVYTANSTSVIGSINDCASTSIAKGIMTVNMPVSGVSQTITVNVTTAGPYYIATTTPVNGVTFAALGTFASTGLQTVDLIATGTPTATGSSTFTLNTTSACSFSRVTSIKCGANVNGVFKQFMCYNLGVTGTQDPLSYQSGNNNGSLYQWGRKTDGHEVRTSATQAGPATSVAAAGNKFITNGTSPFDWITPQSSTLWGDGTTGADQTKTANDPCPAGFKVPSIYQWGGLFKGGITSGAPSTATQNTWTWTGNGFKVGTELYLPLAGYRDFSTASVAETGTSGNYWSSSVINNYSYYLGFNSGIVNSGSNYSRALGLSVRCIAE